jgi:phosphate transport system substrate-binding protein
MKTRAIRVFSALAAAAVVAAPALPSAQAVPPPNTTVDELAVVGSDTTQDVMGSYTTVWNGLRTNASLRNIPAFGGGTQTVPGDSVTSCGAQTYAVAPTAPGTGQIVAPNGSSAGLAALKASVAAGDGCVDIARSSRGRDVTKDLATTEFYAFATDSVTWAAFPGKAPASKNLTLAQLKGIYDCTFTNWNQVGGTNQAIQRYLPQAGSGTRSFFTGTVLGFDPTAAGFVTVNPCPAVNQSLPENNGSVFTAAAKPGAIIPHSVGQWIAQGNGTVSPDNRNGVFVGKIGGVAVTSGTAPSLAPTAAAFTVPNPTATPPVAGFIGARYVYNVIDTTSPQYLAARGAVGYTPFGGSAGVSKLCTPGAAGFGSTISSFGFRPLTPAVVVPNGGVGLCFRS